MDLEIIKIASNTDNVKTINNYTHHSKYKNKLCGDEIEIYLKINNEKINDVAYKTNSCVYCQASATLLSKKIKKKNINKVRVLLVNLMNFFESDNFKPSKELLYFKKIMAKKYILRKDCILLPFKALEKAIK